MRLGPVDDGDGFDIPLPDFDPTIAAQDFYDPAAYDFLATPLTVAETLLEVSLAGPGVESLGLLESLAGRPMSSGQALDAVAAWERHSRWVSARAQAAAVVFMGANRAAGRDAQRREQSDLFELALVTDTGDQLAKVQLARARQLATTLTATGAAVASGDLSAYRARLICDKLNGLDEVTAQAIEARVLPTAHRIKTGTLLAKLRRCVLAAQGPEAAAEHLTGEANRRVTVESSPMEPGLLAINAHLPAAVAVAVRSALETKAKEFAQQDRADQAQAKHAGRSPAPRRSRDQRLADALAWFVLGPEADDPTRPARPAVTVQLTMSLTTLLHLRDHPGDLGGYGPVPADVARLLAQDGEFQRFVHDPVTGYLLDAGRRRYRQPPALRRFTQARDVTDRFPGSNRSASLGDGDHQHPYEDGGQTRAANLANLSRVGHIAKTHNGWGCQGDANGVITWTSPSGHAYEVPPHDYSDEPEPPPPF